MLLLLGNCSATHVNAHISALGVIFVPSNTTVKMQPMQGVIANFNVHYRRHVINSLLIKIQAADESADLKVPLVMQYFSQVEPGGT